MQEENIYARGAILQWAAEILHGDYSSFSDIAAKDIAVLLYAIFNSTSKDGATNNRVNDVVSLHDIQFCDNPTPMTCFLNAKRVLSLVQMLSSCTSEGNSETAMNGNISRHVASSTVGNMTVSAWMEGKAFVEELKMWRWIRVQAFRRGLDKHELECKVQTFLHGAVDRVNTPTPQGLLPPSGKTTSMSKECTQGAEKKQKDVTKDGPVEETARSMKRPRDGDEEAPTLGSKNSVRRQNILDAKPRSECEGDVRCSLPHESVTQAGYNSSEMAAVSFDMQKQHEEEQPTLLLPHVTCDGVAAAPRLLSVLEEVKKELEERKVAAEDVNGGVGAMGTLATCGSESHATDEMRGSGRSLTDCLSCPAIFAEAVQQNYNAIERLEAARKKAVAACLKRDAAGLLEALAFI